MPEPLSHAQRRLWILDRMEPGSAAYNIPGALRLDGRLDRNALWRALESVVRRHEALRTTIVLSDGEPMQQVHEEAGIERREIDLSNEREPEAAARELLHRDASAPFDLVAGPLFRAMLLHLDGHSHILYLNVHHIVCDEWSVGVLLRDLDLLLRDQEPPPLEKQYRDFAIAQNARIRRGGLEVHRRYWREKLRGELPRLDLPLDFSRPPEMTHGGANLAAHLYAATAAGLRELATACGATLFQALTALTKVFLHRYTGQEDVLLGTPIAGRDSAALEDQVGVYVNTLVLRDEIHGTDSFLDVLRRVRVTAEEAYEHGEYPFDVLVKELEVERDLARSPLFDAAIVLQDSDGMAGRLGDLEVSHFDFGFATAKFDLTLYFSEEQRGLRVVFNYNHALFAPRTVARMAAHLGQLAREIVHEPQRPIGELEMLSPRETQRILDEWNGTAARYPADRTLAELFEEQAARTPANVAAADAERTLTYEQLDAEANAIAATLIASGVQPRELVPVLAESSVWTIAALLGVLKAGCAYVPLDPAYPRERLDFVTSDCGGRFLLTRETALAKTDQPRPRPTPDDLAYVIYTSGSTGQPKGCCITHRNVVRLLKNERFPFDFGAEDVWIVAHSFAFDFSVWEMYGALLHGGRVIVPSRDAVRDPAELLRLVREHRVTVLNQTPAAFRNFIAAEDAGAAHDLDAHLRWVIFGGDRLDPAQLRSWAGRYPLDRIRLVNMFGITETTVHVTFGELRDEDVFGAAGRSPIGVPLPETTVYVCNPAMKLQPAGVAGELHVGGSGVARGYLNRPELTEQRFVAHPWREGERLYRSGDVGRWREDGTLEHLGRNDDQVQVRGFRIELREIEHALASLPDVRQALVIARDTPDGVKELVAYVVVDATGDASQIRERLRASMPEHMIPAYVVPLDVLPLTAHNKIDRAALPAPEASVVTANVPPRDELERALAEVWKEVLGVPSVSAFDHYFNLGGDSIKVIRLIGAIQTRMGVRLEVKDVFRHSTVAALAACMRERTGDAAAAELAAAYAHLDRIRDGWCGDPEWEDVYPMTDIELGMVYHNVAEAPAALYHDQFVYSIEDSRFDPARLTRAVELLVRRHPILRTSFHLTGFPEPMQIVHRTRAVAIPYEELSGAGEPEMEAFLADDRNVPFDLRAPGLWRMRVVRIAAARYALLWSFHHAIIDGWSNAAFLAELMEAYFALARDGDWKPAPLRSSYRDFVADQFRWCQSKEAREFWSRELEGHQRMRLPLGRRGGSGRRQRLTLPIDAAVGESLAALARRENVSLRDVHLAAFTALLRLITGEREVLFGLVSSNRPPVPDGDAILGCFLNSVPFRFATSAGTTPAGIVRAAAAKSRELKAYEALPMRRIATERLFDVLFNFVDFHNLDALASLPGTSPRALAMRESTDTPFDVSINNTLGEPTVTIYSLDDTFTGDEIARVADYYFRILDRFASNPDEPLLHEQIIEPLQHDAAGANRHPEESLVSLFLQHAEARPDAVAVTDGSRSLTYAALRDRARESARGIRAGERVAARLPRSVEMVEAILGIAMAGGVYVPIDPEWPRERAEYVLENCGCGNVHNERGLYICYTSGSTGKPKGSLIGERAVLRLVRHTNYVDVQPEDRILQAGSVAFDALTFEVWGALLNGASVHIAPEGVLLDPERFRAFLAERGITILFLTTALFNQLAEYDAAMFANARVLLAGGEKASPRHFELVRRSCPNLALLHVYGPTENTTFSTWHRVGRPYEEHVPIGRAITGTTIYVLDPELQLLPPGVPGEICTGGDGVALGYVNDPELTAKKFVPDPFRDGGRMYRTGDLGRWNQDGDLEFLGRIDQQVKVRGYRVEPGEIEHHLLTHPSVVHAAVFVRQTSVGTNELVAVYTDRGDCDSTELWLHLHPSLPKQMIPAELVRLAAMPLTTAGKIDRRLLPSLVAAAAADQQDADQQDDQPRDEREELLANIWAELFGRPHAGIHDDYFDCGGDSIKAIQLISRLRDAGWKIEVGDLFLHRTIAELAPHLTAASRTEHEPMSGIVPLTPVQRWFFRHQGPLAHFLQPVVVDVGGGDVRTAVQMLWDRHDALRATFDGDVQRVAAPGSAVDFAEGGDVDELYSSFDLARGPLFKARLYGNRLLLAAHHLVVDAVSWRILAEDLETALRGRRLPPRTSSMRDWVGHLQRWGESDACRIESERWIRELQRDAFDLAGAESRYGDARSENLDLGEEETERLLRAAAERGAELREVLIAALGSALRSWHGRDATRILLEAHGREPLDGSLAGSLDVTRTAGWFTTLYPFVIDGDVRAALRDVPRNGIGYAVARHLAPSMEALRAFPEPGIAFNYLGELRAIDAAPGKPVHPDITRPTAIDVVALVQQKHLRLAITYAPSFIDAAAATRVIAGMREALLSLSTVSLVL
jgi:tyrocidine synthetase III